LVGADAGFDYAVIPGALGDGRCPVAVAEGSVGAGSDAGSGGAVDGGINRVDRHADVRAQSTGKVARMGVGAGAEASGSPSDQEEASKVSVEATSTGRLRRFCAGEVNQSTRI